MRPKSEGEAANKEKSASNEKCKFMKQVVTAVLESTQPPTTLFLQLPAPLVVEDPPSTDDERLHELRNPNTVILNGSSGNFGSAGPRSAPATPQGQLGAPQGGQPEALVSPSIQRSPSHSVFSKTDKTNLKLLSTSTPTMTAQGQLAEPPSPKATKDPKVHTTSKARQKKFLRHFPNVEEDEKVLNHYSCALIGDILLQGHLYITKNYFAFYSNVFGYVTKLLIPILTVEEITKEKTARIIPNAVGITTSEDKHIFGSLMSRDSTLAYMKTVWEKAKSEETLPEPEITEPDQDSSESGESDRESPALESIPSGPDILASAKFDRMRKESVRNQTDGSLLERKGSKGFVRTLKDAIAEFRKLPRQSLILVATTLLLILLFLSAGVLLYRIHKIQNKYSISLQGASLASTSEDIYSDLLHWQTHLHSRSADAVNNFLDNNLDQIAKVRQSLEALSALLAGQNTNAVPPTKVDSADLKTESVTVNPAAGNS
uniref:GRAM domain-containing protein n=1 Tax=Dendroctonus ponderosae TaxID=77166 RepID=A0AAR5PNK0_DENPD